jgi:hypothetical protein
MGEDLKKKRAEVVKLVDTQRSGRCTRKGVGVRVPPSAPSPKSTFLLNSLMTYSTSLIVLTALLFSLGTHSTLSCLFRFVQNCSD